ncbi:MAG: sigma-70 family RNA polymerase sigma factor [Verrucomicrobia bacterium]|nr:sigma-70 family RNA polymerase sigma factor [Verrucomicrobiota bacterium]
MTGLNPTFAGIATPDTQSVLERARAGDAEAFGEVYRAYATRLLRQAMALCGNAALAEELAQDTLVEAWRCLRRYHGRCEFFTWLCAILLNRYRNGLRNNRLLPVSTLGNREWDEFTNAVEKLTDHGFWPDAAAELREQTALVWKCLETLPAKQQQVIYLRFYVDDSLEGIAAALGCSVGTVKSRLFHALDKLRGMNVLNAQFVNLKTKG